MAEPYGGIVLGRTGKEVSQKTKSNPEYVKELKKDLYKLGFRIVGKEPDKGYTGNFDRLTEWAVREFQIYAGMKRGARINFKLTAIPESYDFIRLTEVEIPENKRYEGPISGVVNQKTAELIKFWLDDQQSWRCPVIACAFERSGREQTGKLVQNGENLWAGTESYGSPGIKAQVYVRDFTRYYCKTDQIQPQVQFLWVAPDLDFNLALGGVQLDSPLVRSGLTAQAIEDALKSKFSINIKVFGQDNSGPWEIHFPGKPNLTETDLFKVPNLSTDQFHIDILPEWLAVGDFVKYGSLGGPISSPPRHCWAEYGGEILPESFIGESATTDNRSTFRVVRAVSEVECNGFFDSLNAYDTGLISLGPAHWILGLKSKAAISAGELGGFLAYLKYKQADTFNYAFGRFGIELAAEWENGGKNLLNSSNRTYTNWLKLRAEEGFVTLPKVWDEANWFKTWHWFYRFVMAGRLRFAENGAETHSSFKWYRQAMWDVARIRLRDILSAEWPKVDGQQLTYTGPANAAGSAGPRNARIGDVFTSELGVALLMRWHINVPGTVLRKGQAGKHLVAILKNAMNDRGGILPALDWARDNEGQAALIRALFAHINSAEGPLTAEKPRQNLINTLNNIQAWPEDDSTRQKKGYQLRQGSPNPDFATLVDRQLETAHSSFNFYQQGINVAVASPVFKPYTAIPISDPPIANGDRDRFGISVLGSPISGSDRLEFLGLTLNMCFPDPPSVELFQDEVPQEDAITPQENEEENDPPLQPLERPGFFGLQLPISYIADPERPLLVTDLVETLEGLPNEDLQIFNNADTPHQQSVEITPLVSQDRSQLGKHEWRVDISNLVEFLGFTPEVSVVLENGQVSLIVQITHPLLKQPLQWKLDANGSATPQEFTFNTVEDEGNSIARFSIPIDTISLLQSLPLIPNGTVDPSLQIDCILNPEKSDRNFRIQLVLNGAAGIDLGSPLARLSLANGKYGVCFDALDGLQLILPEQVGASLKFDLFEKIQGSGRGAVVNNIWSQAQPDGSLVTLDLGQLEPDLDRSTRTITWRTNFPNIPQKLIEEWLREKLQNANQLDVDTSRQLKSLAGSVLGALNPTQVTFVTFDKCGDEKPFEFQIVGNTGKLQICLRIKVADSSAQNLILEGDGKFTFLFKIQNGAAEMEPGSFRCEGETLLQVKRNYNWTLLDSELISLHVPLNTAFKFISQPSDPKLEYAPDESFPPGQEGIGSPARISVRVPASKAYRSGEENPRQKAEPNIFTFELDEFALHSGGYDLKGKVCSENISFTSKGDEPIFAEPLAVKSPGKQESGNGQVIGQIEFKNSLLVQGSLQASAKLRYFDDAIGTFTLLLAQDPVTRRIDAEGSLDVSGLSEFHVDRLYLSCLVRAFHLSVRYSNGTWEPDAWISGQIKFAPPQGISAGTMKELSNLFSGLEFGFERLNPLDLGKTKVGLSFPAKQFEFADIFEVKLKGVEFNPENSLRLLGDIAIKQLPGVNASLRFGDITLRQGRPPSFQVSRIGAQFTVPGGFKLDGDFQFVELEAESGFVGAFALKTETFEGSGLLKLTRVRTEDRQAWVPSLAVYLETNIDVALFAGFFLRSLGVGLGIYQALDGLEPNPKKTLPQKIGALVNNPAGLPVPRRPESWKPARPEKVGDRLNWMLVANGLITLGKLPNDKPHPIAGSILLAIDQDLQIIAGVNLWLFASPDDTRRTEFAVKPVGRGAIGLSVKEQRLFAMFRTLKDPKFRNDAPPILKEVLSKVETSLFFSADRKGMLVEVGWPWETRIKGHALGGLIRGELVSGFRFGIYQGVISFGLNYAVSIELKAETRVGFDTRLGSAEARLSANGKGMFRASFAGALDREFRTYLVGDVRIQATLSLTAQASVSLSKRFTRWLKISISIRFKVTIQISIAAALTAAMEPGPNLGFTGEAEVAVSVCGYRLAGRLAFASRPEIIGRVRNRIKALLPPNLAAKIQGSATPVFSLLAAPEAAIEQPPKPWTYHFRKVPGTKYVRVLLFPSPGTPYPKPSDKLSRFTIQLRENVKFDGFVGSKQTIAAEGRVLSWSENLMQELSIASTSKTGPGSELPEAEQERIYVRDVLQSIQDEKTDFRKTQEISDSRPLNPSPEHTDDETRAIAPNTLNSPNLARNTRYDQELANAWSNDPKLPKFQILVSNELETITKAVEKLDELARLEKKPDSIASDTPGELSNLFTKLTRIQPNVSVEPNLPDLPKLPEKIFVYLLSSSEAERFQANKVWRVDPSDVNDSKGFFIAKQDNGLQVVPNNYQEGAEEGISAGMLLAELLEILADDKAQVNENYVDQDGEEGFAHLLNLILQFEVPDEVYGKPDPVPDLIDLTEDKGIRIEDQDMEPLVPPLGKGIARPEYDLVAGPVAQSNDQICLTWLFLREDPSVPEGGPTERRQDDPANVFTELQKFVVIRRNLSRLGDKPREFPLYQSWIKGKESEPGMETLIRPPFQFVDNQLEEIGEGNQLQYEVIAKAPDRVLTSCLINVVRRTVKPLPPPGQALALHNLQKKRIEIVVVIDPVIVKDENTGEERDAMPEQLRLRYRFVRAGTVGSYGFESRSEVSTNWVSGLPSRETDENLNEVRIEFASVKETQALPWDETTNFPPPLSPNDTSDRLLEWKQQSLEQVDPLTSKKETQTALIGYYVEIPEQLLDTELGEQWKRPGWAIEFYVGQQKNNSKQLNQPIERSVLQKCRHAIVPILSPGTGEKETTMDAAERLDLGRGNLVEALEYIDSNIQDAQQWLDSNRLIDYIVNYTQASNPLTLTLAWRHDLSGRKGYDDPLLNGYGDSPIPDKFFNPVVGYQLYRQDAYDPQPPSPTVELAIRAVPDLLYRAQPASIEVKGLADQPDPTISRAQVPTTIEEEVRDRLDRGLKQTEGNTPPIADWVPELPQDLQEFPIVSLADGQEPPPPFQWTEVQPGGQIWLHQDIQAFLKKLATALKETQKLNDVSYVLTLREPLEVKSYELPDSDSAAETLVELTKAIQNLQTEFNDKTDPYGWRTLESLGLACECRFVTSEGRSIPTEAIISALIFSTDLPLISVGIFLAEDQKTPLDVLRLVYARSLKAWEQEPQRPFNLDIILSHRFLGSQQADLRLPEAQRPLLIAPVKKWLEEVNPRLQRSQLLQEESDKAWRRIVTYRYDARTNETQGKPNQPVPQAVVALPIQQDGRLECSLPIPDGWAHRYKIALALVRRYDLALGRISQSPTKADQFIEVPVDRSNPLVPHNLLATPLNGSIQAVVFRHPAAFAASASAVQAVHIQYSGTTVYLQRRIKDLGKLQSVYDRFITKYPGLKWGEYQTWLEREGKELFSPEQAPDIVKKDGSPGTPDSIALKPVLEAKSGIYGTDRYVYPDLPGYYEYRVAAYSTAGRSKSSPEATSWVTPLYQSGPDARQQPHAEQCLPTTVYSDDGTTKQLTLQIPLVHPRQHMREEIRGLWVDADQTLSVNGLDDGTGVPTKETIRFGSLPDLYLTYQAYLWINNTDSEDVSPVFLPLLRILPPEVDKDDAWFSVELQAPGMLPNPLEPNLSQVEGQLIFNLQITLTSPLADPLISALQTKAKTTPSGTVAEIIPIVVQRGGIWSELPSSLTP